MRNRLTISFLLSLAVGSGCTSLHSGHMFAVEGPSAHPLPNSRGVIAEQEKVIVATAAQNEVKEADVFYIVVFNQSLEYIEYDRSALRLIDAEGKEHKPLSRARVRQLQRRFKPKPPIGFSTDIFTRRSARLDTGDRVSPLNPADVFTSKIMPKSQYAFFIYFPKKSATSPFLHLKIPGIALGERKQELTYMFRFEVQRE